MFVVAHIAFQWGVAFLHRVHTCTAAGAPAKDGAFWGPSYKCVSHSYGLRSSAPQKES